MDDALHLRLARGLPAKREVADVSTRSPLFYVIRSNISIAFALLQLAQTSLRLNKPPSEEVLVKAERAYEKSMQYVELLTEEDRTSALFELRALRTALDEFRSA
jgi:hypothetical protein